MCIYKPHKSMESVISIVLGLKGSSFSYIFCCSFSWFARNILQSCDDGSTVQLYEVMHVAIIFT